MAVTRTMRLMVPNTLTGLRLILVAPIIIAALHDAWVLGFWLIVVALMTDFLDGLAAKRLNAYSAFGAHLDSIADFLLATGGIAGIVWSGHLPLWIGIVLLVPALAVGYVKFLSRNTTARAIQPALSVPYLFAAWIFMTLTYATQAFGWSVWYAVVVIVLLIGAAALKRHRLRAWFGWVVARLLRA